jgi:SEC-C motif domain protein
MSLCPCGSEKEYNACCEVYISGKELAPTAEATMRARYSAYVKQKLEYVKTTHCPDRMDSFDEDGVKQWSSEAVWNGLQIVSTIDGLEKHDSGMVEFIASYEMDGKRFDHHEESQFVKVKDAWHFQDGNVHGESVVRSGPKVGRNDPCPCGSGKKHKKCCL